MDSADWECWTYYCDQKPNWFTEEGYYLCDQCWALYNKDW